MLDCTDAYGIDGTIYRKSSTHLVARHSVVYFNENQTRSRASISIYSSEDAPIPTFDGEVVTMAQATKHGMCSAVETELASLFETARKCADIRQALNRMSWPQKLTRM